MQGGHEAPVDAGEDRPQVKGVGGPRTTGEILDFRQKGLGKRAREFGGRQPQHGNEAHPPGQGFAHRPHQVEGLGTGEPEPAGPSLLVHPHLDVGQQFGRVLDFVDEHRRGEALEEEARIAAGQFPNVRVVQGDVGSRAFGQMAQQRGLAHLSRPGEQHHRESPRCFQNCLFNYSIIIHRKPRLFQSVGSE